MLIEALDSAPRDAARLVRPLSLLQAHNGLAGGWSVIQIVSHMATMEPLVLARFQRVVLEEIPMEPTMATVSAAVPGGAPVDDYVRRFDQLRQETTRFLTQLSHQAWLRACTHETLGVAKLHQLVRLLIAHDSEHLAQISTVRANL